MDEREELLERSSSVDGEAIGEMRDDDDDDDDGDELLPSILITT